MNTNTANANTNARRPTTNITDVQTGIGIQIVGAGAGFSNTENNADTNTVVNVNTNNTNTGAGTLPLPPSTAGPVVGGFRVHEEIGRGSFATVYIGARDSTGNNDNDTDGKPSLRVAIKTVARDKLNRKLAENLESEIKILRDMHHPNIVALIDIVKGNVVPYVFNQKSQGVSKQASEFSLASPWGGINEAIIRHFLAQLASALETLRSLSLIHRDLKPQNLLLDPPPADAPSIEIKSPYLNAPPFIIPALPTLKLADFGFARALPQQSLASTLCGSPLYMAPEILRGDRYDAKVDLWSVGTILYEMITGRPPFKAQNHIDLLRKIDKGEGWIKFPGDDDGIANNSGGINSRSRNIAIGGNGIVSNSVSGRRPLVGVSGVVGVSGGQSLGAATPRFLNGLQPGGIGIGARPISEDLKDLARRLLRRNPVERMSFEEFFMHPAFNKNESDISTSSDSSLTSVSQSIINSDSAITSSVISQPVLTISAGQNELLQQAIPNHRASTQQSQIQSQEQLQQRQQQQRILQLQKGTNISNLIPNSSNEILLQLPSTKTSRAKNVENQSLMNPMLPNPLSTPFPTGTVSPLSKQQSQSQNSKPSMYHYIPGAISSTSSGLPISKIIPANTLHQNTPSPLPQLSPSIDMFEDLEPPFAGYDLDPVKIFGDLLLSKPPSAAQLPKKQISQTANVKQDSSNQEKKSLPASVVDNEDISSSISSLGSLELSEEDEDVGTIPAHTVNESNNRRPLKQKQRQDQQNQQSQNNMPVSKGNLTDINPQNVKTNDVFSTQNEQGSSGTSSSGKALKNSFDDFVVIDSDSRPTEVNWITPLETGLTEALMDQPQRPVSTSPHLTNQQFQLQQQENSQQQQQHHLQQQQQKHQKHRQQLFGPFSKRSSNASLNSAIGATAASPPASPFSKKPDSLRGSRSFDKIGGPSPVIGSIGSGAGIGFHDYGTRVFGSLRDSAHNFLDAMGAGGSQTSVSRMSQNQNLAVHQQQQQQQQNASSTSSSPVSGNNAAQLWTVELADEANLLTILNLSTLRGHALHTFADECHRDVILLQKRLSHVPEEYRNENHAIETSVIISSGRIDPVQAEEALSLYLAALKLYQLGLEAARALWSREQSRLAKLASTATSSSVGSGTGIGNSQHSDTTSIVAVDLKSLNASVQWMKDKFDDCLERAHEMRGVIVDGGVTNNGGGGGDDDVGFGARPVDRMIYERSLEVCRAAAHAEASGLYTSAEIGYTHAVHLLEAILYAPPPATIFQGSQIVGNSAAGSVYMDGSMEFTMSDNDRVVVERFLVSIGKRMSRVKESVDSN
ncbi:Serine/threonine-protein kinase [Physocladia obscura]|uniref:non-specific serine/threonine protein kinase n=1 Tax=Physocladia obscura TaxID=109957 RepID=A0AAD5T7R3_9FUNG|nr:Serine/threonine-protein kinase [Physocladia obscura]